MSLAAAAALSLLAVSAVFAFGGWSDPVVASVKQTTIILPVGSGPTGANRAVVVLPARHVSDARPKSRAKRHHARRAQPPPPRVVPQPAVTSKPKPVSLPTQAEPDPEPAIVMPPVIEKPKSVGDHVRAAGDDLSATVENAGSALAVATQPLLPPVSSALQKITNLVVTLLRRAGGDVAGLLNRVLPAR